MNFSQFYDMLNIAKEEEMKEIEILVSFDNSKEEVLKILEKFDFIKEKELYDIYFFDELRDNLKPEPNLRVNELFRVRTVKNSPSQGNIRYVLVGDQNLASSFKAKTT